MLLSAMMFGCSEDDEVAGTSPQLPVITLDSDNAVYQVKTGRELSIVPTYENVDNALYIWRRDGVIVCEDPSYTFVAQSQDEGNSFYLTLTVSTLNGSTAEEMRVNVVSLEIPYISLTGASEGYTVMVDDELALTPLIAETSIETSYRWTVDGSPVSQEKNYTFSSSQTGAYTLCLTASNEDGEDSVEFTVTVCTPEEMPFSWTFPQTVFNVSQGRSIRLMPYDVENLFDGTFTWEVDGSEVQSGDGAVYIFSATAQGAHTVTVTMSNDYTIESQDLTVNVCPVEGTYYRQRTADSSADWNKVYEFLAAPGQFVDGSSTTTMEQAVATATTTLAAGSYVSLGGFGGYIVVGFDHSIDNSGSYDFAVRGNAFSNSSEPGIVWVMQDENGNGLPDDTWYELAGSETGKEGTVQDYAVTYYKPANAGLDVQWVDNQGGSGTLNPKYPAWADEEKYTLRGTCLAARNSDQSGNGSYWTNADYDWGYADNYSTKDMITGTTANHFRISDAIDYKCDPVPLQYIDFVKVQTGVNAQSGWLGEISTEVLGFYDYNMQK